MIAKELRLWLRDARIFLFKVPKTKYQWLDKMIVVAFIVFPLMLMIILSILGR